MAAPATARFVKRYTNWTGRAFLRFEDPATGRVVDIKVRDGRNEPELLTRAEAKAAALEKFRGNP